MRLYGINIAKEMDIQRFRKGAEPVPATKLQMIDLGQPILAAVDRVVTATNMKVGDYTIAAQPVTPRRLTVTHALDGALDTLGHIVIEGTDILDKDISEIVVPEEDDTVITEKIFKSVTKVTGVDWVEDAPTDEDQISVGVDDMLGVHIDLLDIEQVLFALLGTEIIVPSAFDEYQLGKLPDAGIDVSGATYDGTKRLYLLAYYNDIYVS